MNEIQDCKPEPLGNKINLKRGYDLPNRLRKDGKNPIYSSAGISGFHSEFMCEPPGVITGRYGTIGQLFHANTRYWPLNTTLYVQDFKGNDAKFVFYFLKTLNWEKYSDKSAVPGVNRNDVHQEMVLFPDPAEQRAIAAVLSSLDDKIDLLHRQNKTLEALAETLFRQWFVEEASDDWEERPLSAIATFLNGLACQKFPANNSIERLPVLKIKELSNGVSESSDFASSNVKPEYIVTSGDVIFAWSASLMVKLWDGPKCVLNQHLFKVSSAEFPKWFYYLWCKHHLREFISISQSHATTMGHIKRGDLDKAMVAVPGSDILNEMNKLQEPIMEKQIAVMQQIGTLENLRNMLLPKLMSGEVRVAT